MTVNSKEIDEIERKLLTYADAYLQGAEQELETYGYGTEDQTEMEEFADFLESVARALRDEHEARKKAEAALAKGSPAI